AGALLATSVGSRSVAFYHYVLGLDYGPGSDGQLRQAGVEPETTGALNGTIRFVAIPIPGTGWHIQVIETSGIERRNIDARRQDIGAAGLIFYVRDFDSVLRALKVAKTEIVTEGGMPVRSGRKGTGPRAILTKDPDGFFVEIREAEGQSESGGSSNVISARMALSIGDTEKTARYWRDVLGFDVQSEPNYRLDAAEARLHGTRGAKVRTSLATLRADGPFLASNLVFELDEFAGIERKTLKTRYEDPGTGGFVLRLRTGNSGLRGKEMADFVSRVKSSGQYKVLTLGGDAVDRGRRLVIFFQELNGFMLEVTQTVKDSSGSGVP
ncbi:MAG TPA: VOC family protein, partial [Bryobacteraceae bacterium]|nr:VOC family protein [Bryobacteraceae bacterium]